MTSPFMEALRADMRLRGYSIHTEKSYLENNSGQSKLFMLL